MTAFDCNSYVELGIFRVSVETHFTIGILAMKVNCLREL